MPQTERNLEILRRAAQAGFGEDDVSAVAEYLRRDGGNAQDGHGRES